MLVPGTETWEYVKVGTSVRIGNFQRRHPKVKCASGFVCSKYTFQSDVQFDDPI